jgi:uncharacterized membrane protein
MTTPIDVIPTPEPEVTSDDRLWVVLCLLFTPLFPVITLFLEDKKARPFVKYHNVPALLLGVIEAILAVVLSFIPVVRCLSGLMWIYNIYLAVKANGGKNMDIPVLTAFSKGQGWS